MSGWEVRPSDPRVRRRLWLAVGLLLLAVPVAYYLGAHWASVNPQRLAESQRELLRQLAEQQQELDQLRQRYVVVASADKVNQQAGEQNRQTIKALEEQIFKLQQDLAFYKGVLAPASRRDGLRVRSVEVQGTDDPRRFRYKLLLSRVGKDDVALEGNLQVSVLGQQAGKEVSLRLATLSEEHAEPSIPFAFKHFQAIPAAGRFAELELPEGFAPRQIKVVAQLKGESKALERTFPWIDQE
ncbi:hypothetical protein DN824_21860 [Stutzerimonas nosocomialis]|uniref:DUF6776 family protein n=1 Tax=Stutzerimonas nosocomialis TaxID=1056496 RepID=UPI0011097754|nr:DUF6776 family protein [Stutzerimonas nosocomialis]TLX52792.1 hypothetical protein DN824_21860 [Stutzerimonas nosocomialis]